MNLIELTKPIVFFDLETTGTNIKEDYIVEIAMVKITPDAEQLTFNSYIKPPKPIPPGATKVHGIDDDVVKDAPAMLTKGAEILSFLQGCDIAGYNSNRFDIPLLYTELKRVGLRWNWEASHFIDVGNIYKIKEPRTLAAAHKFYVGEELLNAHTALADVEASIRVFSEQLNKYEDLRNKPVPEIALMSNFDRKIVDITGTFGLNEANEIIFNFGKHKGAVAKHEKSYLQWMLKPTSGFDEDVKAIVTSLLYGKLSFQM